MKYIIARLIETSYDYQKEIAREACLHNSIICLATALERRLLVLLIAEADISRYEEEIKGYIPSTAEADISRYEDKDS